jgi:hypothetical protein
MFSEVITIPLRIVSEVPIFKNTDLLPADLLHCFNFFTIPFKGEYLKLNIEVVPAYSNVMRPIYLTSG